PNSAIRKVAKVAIKLKNKRKNLIAYIPGFGPHNLQPLSTVLVKGGRCQDLPGVKYRLVRKHYDFLASERFLRKNRRSKFSVKNLEKKSKKGLAVLQKTFEKRLINAFMRKGNYIKAENIYLKVVNRLSTLGIKNSYHFIRETLLKMTPIMGVDPIMSSILTNYTEKAKSIINKNVQQQVRLKEHLQFSQIRRLIDINHENEVYKNKELKKRDEKKLKKNIQLNFIKTVVIAAITKKTQQIESKKELILKVLLNILRRKGEVPFEGKIAMLFPYLKELGRKQGDAKIKNLALNLQMRIVTDLLNYKGDKEVKRNHVALVRNRIDYLEYMSQNPRKARGQISDYKAFWKAKSRGRMMYAKLTEQKNMLEQAALKNNYNILNNIIESEKKLYKLRLPKQRVTVPTLYQVYERVINHIKGLETRTQGDTKHIDTTVTARQEYYRIYHPKEIDPLAIKKKQALKSTALKPLGPIGRVIGTDLFRRRVITQVLLNLKAQIKYNVLDIEIRNPGVHSIINTILYKLWYIYEDQGLLRMYKFKKNKAHGSMRPKKQRRL
ncbi:hypothetical protein ACTFIY_004504, partial [Dictyostelium cf. discoideum]